MHEVGFMAQGCVGEWDGGRRMGVCVHKFSDIIILNIFIIKITDFRYDHLCSLTCRGLIFVDKVAGNYLIVLFTKQELKDFLA